MSSASLAPQLSSAHVESGVSLGQLDSLGRAQNVQGQSTRADNNTDLHQQDFQILSQLQYGKNEPSWKQWYHMNLRRINRIWSGRKSPLLDTGQVPSQAQLIELIHRHYPKLAELRIDIHDFGEGKTQHTIKTMNDIDEGMLVF